MSKRIAILGSTGSIGRQAIEVLQAHPGRFRVVALAAGSNAELLMEQAEKHVPDLVVLGEGASRRGFPGGSRVEFGADGLMEAATHPDAEMVLIATSGIAGLRPLLGALRAGKTVALANKESLVVAGDVVMAALRSSPGARIVPVDSEHNAAYRALRAFAPAPPSRIVLTASGGPFHGRDERELERVRPEDALAHPTWRMGPKVTVDSATLMNKGFEVIEARWLFSVPPDRISVLVNRGSVVHCVVEGQDGTMIACMGPPDMRVAIQHALFDPEQPSLAWGRLRLEDLGALRFELPDVKSFPCLGYAYEALKAGGAVPAAVCGADEAAVSEFLGGRLKFTDIARVVKATLDEARSAMAEPERAELVERDIDLFAARAESAYEWGMEFGLEVARSLGRDT